MAGVDNGVLYPESVLREWTTKVFLKLGVPKDDSELFTDSLIEANLRGVDTHGITRMLPTFVKRLQTGVLNTHTRLEIIREKSGTALIDCNNGIGQVSSKFAMELAIKKAQTTGIALVATTHSNHFGSAAYWATKALDHNMIGFSSTNAPAAVAPTGGAEAFLGTNPFAIAIPAGTESPFVLDMATSVVARGRIHLYAKQNMPLEPGWALDEYGKPTIDPHAALRGFLTPIGGYKGYGISLAIDMICGVLTGSSYGTHFPGFLADNLDDPTDLGSIFAAINIESFIETSEFKLSMDQAIREIKNCKKSEGTQRIYIPGEIELEMKKERLSKGIPLPEVVVREFENLGKELNVLFPVLD